MFIMPHCFVPVPRLSTRLAACKDIVIESAVHCLLRRASFPVAALYHSCLDCLIAVRLHMR